MSTKNKAAADCLGQEFTITREFAAPRELVFKACTDPKHLAQWWGPKGFSNPVCAWDARPSGKVFVVMRAPDGTDFPMGGEFREIVAPERLVVMTGALDDQGKFLFEILHTTTLNERNGKTQLTMHSRVVKTTPGAGKYIGGFEMGMTLSLERLAGHLAQGTEPFVIERVFDAPVAAVWRAITDRNEMKRWYFDVEEFKPKAGFKFEFTVEHEGVTYSHLCKVTDVIPEKRIAYTWRYAGQPGDSLVVFDLLAEGAKTRLRLTHMGLETFPATPAYARKNFETGWTEIIGSNLKAYLENADTASDREIVMTRVFDAPRELVWQAMTDPKHVVNWWGPRGFSTTIETMDVRPGGVWKHMMRGPDGKNYPNKSIFKEVVKPERLVFSHGGGHEHGPGANFMATWSFEEVAPGRTRITARLVFPSTAARDFVVKEFGAIEGGKQTLERLSEYLPKMAKGAVAETASREIVTTRIIGATRERVFEAWMDPKQLAQWWGPKGFTNTFHEFDPKPGGVWRFVMHGPDGTDYHNQSVFVEIVKPECLVFEHLKPIHKFHATATFGKAGKKTRLSFRMLFESAAECDKVRTYVVEGNEQNFDRLEALLAKIPSRKS